MTDQPTANPVEFELELPKIAHAGEWIPVLVEARRPDDWPVGVLIRNVATLDKSVQIDLDFLDRDAEIRPGETYRFTVPIQVPTQRDLLFDAFKVQVREVGKTIADDKPPIALPKKRLQVRPSLGKEIKVSLEPICVYEEGTKAVLRIKHHGTTPFHKLTINLSPATAIFAGKSVVQRQSFLADNEESIELVLKEKQIEVKLAVDVENQRVEKSFLIQVDAPPPSEESQYRFLEPRLQFDGRLEVKEVDATGASTGSVALDQNAWWPLSNGSQYQIVVRPKSGANIDSVKFRDIPGVIFVRSEQRNPKDGSWEVLIDTIANNWTGQPEILTYDVDCGGTKARGEMPIYLHPEWWKPWKIAFVVGAAVTLQGVTSAVTKVVHHADDVFEVFTDFKLEKDYNLLFLLTIPVCWLGLRLINWIRYRVQS